MLVIEFLFCINQIFLCKICFIIEKHSSYLLNVLKMHDYAFLKPETK